MTRVKATEFSTKNVVKLEFLILLAILRTSMLENVEATSRGGFGNMKTGFRQLYKFNVEAEEIIKFPQHFDSIYRETVSVQVTPRSPSEIMSSCVEDCERFQVAPTSDTDNPTPGTPEGVGG